ncbi:hypothetical protein STHU_41290 [Allostella humosa]|nr:hypothetical protein STHU_41290 [Stella humosa]
MHRRQAEPVIDRFHPPLQHRARLVGARQGFQVDAGQDLARRPRRQHAPARHQHDRAGEARHLVDRVADIEDRDARFVAQAFDVRQDLGLAGMVEGGQRLVHQEDARAGQQRPADRHPLALAARQPGRPAIQEMVDAEDRHHPVQAVAAVGRTGEPAAIQQVVADAEMGEEARFLEDVANAPAVARHEDAGRPIHQHPPVDHHAPLVRPHQPGHDVDERGLARAGAAEERRQPGLAGEAGIQREAPEAVADIDVEPHQVLARTSSPSR